MAKTPADLTFVRRGRSLAAWLLDLVAEDRPTRAAADRTLSAMLYASPGGDVDLANIEWPPHFDAVSHQKHYAAAIRTAVGSRDFPQEEFVGRLCLLRVTLKRAYLAKCDLSTLNDEGVDKLLDRLVDRIAAAADEAEREQALHRYRRATYAAMERDNKLFADAEYSLMSHWVLEQLDTALFANRTALRVLMNYQPTFHEAAAALARIGPPAVGFAASLLEQLDVQAKMSSNFDGAAALGSIGRDDPTVVDALLQRLRTGDDAIRVAAAESLISAGPRLAGRTDEAIALLLAMTYEDKFLGMAVPALASVGRDSAVALARVLELAAPRPPDWRPCEWLPEERFDNTMVQRGIALFNLRFFQGFAARVIPVLIDAFDTFEEYDPDYTYNGEHKRVCGTLETFGTAAAPAVARLVRYLEAWTTRPEPGKTWPKDVFCLLKVIGPAARSARPVLERLRSGDSESTDPYDSSNALDAALLALLDVPHG